MSDLTLQLTNALQTIFSQKSLTLNYPLNPKLTSILLWKNTSPKSPDSFLLKIGGQKFIGLPRSDKNNEVYWKFRNLEDENEDNSPPIEALTKFSERQQKFEDKISNGKFEPTINSSYQFESVSN